MAQVSRKARDEIEQLKVLIGEELTRSRFADTDAYDKCFFIEAVGYLYGKKFSRFTSFIAEEEGGRLDWWDISRLYIICEVAEVLAEHVDKTLLDELMEAVKSTRTGRELAAKRMIPVEAN